MMYSSFKTFISLSFNSMAKKLFIYFFIFLTEHLRVGEPNAMIYEDSEKVMDQTRTCLLKVHLVHYI